MMAAPFKLRPGAIVHLATPLIQPYGQSFFIARTQLGINGREVYRFEFAEQLVKVKHLSIATSY
jgi:hypothetical protein